MNIQTLVTQSVDKARRGDLYPLSNLIDRLRYRGYQGVKYNYQCLSALFSRYGCNQDEFEKYLENMDNIETTTRYSNPGRY